MVWAGSAPRPSGRRVGGTVQRCTRLARALRGDVAAGVGPLRAFRPARRTSLAGPPAGTRPRAPRPSLAGTRVDMGPLAAELGVDRATLFRWVGNRDQLLTEVIWSLFVPTWRRAVDGAAGCGAPRVAGALPRFTPRAPRGRRRGRLRCRPGGRRAHPLHLGRVRLGPVPHPPAPGARPGTAAAHHPGRRLPGPGHRRLRRPARGLRCRAAAAGHRHRLRAHPRGRVVRLRRPHRRPRARPRAGARPPRPPPPARAAPPPADLLAGAEPAPAKAAVVYAARLRSPAPPPRPAPPDTSPAA